MVERNTRIRASQISSILPDDLEATNALVEGYVAKYDSATGKFTWIQMSSGGGTSYRTTFTNSDLASGDVINIVHNLDTQHPAVVVYDNSNLQILPTEIEYIDSNTIQLDFTDLTPLTGTYSVRVIGSASAIGGLTQTFVDGDLVSGGILQINHNIGQRVVFVDIYDNNYKKIEPDEITLTDTNNCSVDLSSFGTLSGTWTAILSIGIPANNGMNQYQTYVDNKIYRNSFTSSDLASGNILAIQHDLGQQYCVVQIYDENDKKVNPDDIELVDSNNLSIDLHSFTVTGTWHIIIVS